MPDRQHALVVLNGRAARIDMFDEPARNKLAQVFDLDVQTPSDPSAISRIISDKGPDADIVIIGGGDGTISLSMKAFLPLGKPLGILPLGTANDLARTLGIAPLVSEAVDTIVDGATHSIDVGQVNDQHFLNVASIGLAAAVSEAQTVTTKKRWKILAYPASLVRAFRAAKPLRLKITRDGEEMKLRVWQLGVGNGRFHGGGLTVSEDAAVDDGKLNCYAVVPTNHWALVTVLVAMKSGRPNASQSIRTFTADSLIVKTSREVNVNTDGELTTTTPAEFSILRDALTVFIPRDLPPDHVGLTV